MPDAGHGEHSLLLSSSWSIILPCHMSSSNILVESMQFHAAPCEEQQKRQEAEPSIGDLQPDLMSYWCAEPIRLSAYEATNSENVYAMQMLMAVAAPRVSQQAGTPVAPHAWQLKCAASAQYPNGSTLCKWTASTLLQHGTHQAACALRLYSADALAICPLQANHQHMPIHTCACADCRRAELPKKCQSRGARSDWTASCCAPAQVVLATAVKYLAPI